jgi:hypothetical protein
MRKEDKRAQLRTFFANVDEDKRVLAYDTIEEYLLFLERIEELRLLPFIKIHPTNRERQEVTPAAKLIREYSQAIDAKRKTLLTILYRVESSAADDLLARLSEFE